MVHDSCREQASSLDTENMSNAIRNTNCRKKDGTSNDYSSFLTKSVNLKTLSNAETDTKIEVYRRGGNNKVLN